MRRNMSGHLCLYKYLWPGSVLCVLCYLIINTVITYNDNRVSKYAMQHKPQIDTSYINTEIQ